MLFMGKLKGKATYFLGTWVAWSTFIPKLTLGYNILYKVKSLDTRVMLVLDIDI